MCRIEWLQDCPDTNIGKSGTSTVIFILPVRITVQREMPFRIM